MRVGFCLPTLLLLSSARLVHASAAAQCIAAHADGQVQRKAGKLLTAHERFAACAVDSCPTLIRKDCLAFQAELDAAQPHVVIVVNDDHGQALPDARIAIDGGAANSAGSSIALDPGKHEALATLPGGRTEKAHFVLHEAEQARVVVAVPSAPAADLNPAARPIPTVSYVLGGTALVALGSFTYFGLRGHGKESDMDPCAATHSCTESEVHEMRQLYLAADISLGISLLSLGLGTYFFLTRPEQASEPAQASERVRLNAVATPGACFISASGHF